jgi:hypothetical protein
MLTPVGAASIPTSSIRSIGGRPYPVVDSVVVVKDISASFQVIVVHE